MKKKTNCCKSNFGFLCSTEPLYDENSLRSVEKLLVKKSQVSLAVTLVLVIANYYTDLFSWTAKKVRDDNSADVDLEFQEAILPVVDIAVLILRGT